MPKKEFLIVAWYTEGEGNFNNFVQTANTIEEAIELFELDFPKHKVIHIFEGATQRKPYAYKYLINIGFLSFNQKINEMGYVKVPFEFSIDNGIVEFWMIDERDLQFLFRPTIVDSLQETADVLVGEEAAQFHLNYKDGSKVMNWNRVLTHV